jgi:hypothetical protein
MADITGKKAKNNWIHGSVTVNAKIHKKYKNIYNIGKM